MNNNKIYIYQVLPRLFGNTNETREINGTIEKNGVGKFDDFTEKSLSEIKKMGFNHIWFTGIIEHATQTDYSKYGIQKDSKDIVKGMAGSPYAIKDYYDVDPDLAKNVKNRMSEFEKLISRCKKVGLKPIIDFVPNHVARQYKSDVKPKHVKDLGENDDVSLSFDSKNNFYYLPNQQLDLSLIVDDTDYIEKVVKVTGNNVLSNKPSKHDWYETIKLNYGVNYFSHENDKIFDPIPDTWEKMRDILMFWGSKQVGGFRCDMAEMVPVEFWGWVIPQIKDRYPDIIFIAEVYNPNEYLNYIEIGKFDYLYDKVDLYDVLIEVTKDNKPTSDITFAWQKNDIVKNHLLYFLENHDEIRLASKHLLDNPWKAIPAFQLICLMNNNPVMLYSGQEIGEDANASSGFSGDDGRTTIFDYWSQDKIIRWNNEGKYDTEKLTKEEIELRNKYISIIKLSEQEACFQKGNFYDLMYANYDNCKFNSCRQFVFIRNYKKTFMLVVINFSSDIADVEVEIPSEAYTFMNINSKRISEGVNLRTNNTVDLPRLNKTIEMSIPAYDCTIYKFQEKARK